MGRPMERIFAHIIYGMACYEEKGAAPDHLREDCMASILVRRDQFNITPQGIVHKPTDSHFAPHPGDPSSGRIHLGRLGVVPVGEEYDPEQVKTMMMELWREYVTENSNWALSSVNAGETALAQESEDAEIRGSGVVKLKPDRW